MALHLAEPETAPHRSEPAHPVAEAVVLKEREHPMIQRIQPRRRPNRNATTSRGL